MMRKLKIQTKHLRIVQKDSVGYAIIINYLFVLYFPSQFFRRAHYILMVLRRIVQLLVYRRL